MGRTTRNPEPSVLNTASPRGVNAASVPSGGTVTLVVSAIVPADVITLAEPSAAAVTVDPDTVTAEPTTVWVTGSARAFPARSTTAFRRVTVLPRYTVVSRGAASTATAFPACTVNVAVSAVP